MPKIYTKVGDGGQTALIGGAKVPKNDPRIEAYGTVDELNSCLGAVRAELERLSRDTNNDVVNLSRLNADLETLQHWLFDLGSLLAASAENRDKFKLSPVSKERVEWLEGRIDGVSALLEPLQNFILPGGSELAARLHLARTIARRAERRMVELGEDLPALAIAFINRVSDYFFTVARYSNKLLGIKDVLWEQNRK